MFKYQTLIMEIGVIASVNVIILLVSVPNNYNQLSLTLEMLWQTYF